MAEAPTLQQEELKLKGTFAGQAVDLVAKGTTIILLAAVAIVGGLALREHANRDAAEQRIEALLADQNKLLHEQTNQLQAEIDDVRCIVGISIFVAQFPRGAIEWDQLPVHLHACYPEYAKKVPRR